MSGKFEDIHLVLPEIISDFESIQTSGLSSLQASRAMAKSFRERLEIYYSMVLKIEDDYAIFDAIFGSQAHKFRDEMEYFSTHLPQPRKIQSHVFLSKVASTKTVLLVSLEAPEDPTFSSALLPSTSSWMWLPIIKQDNVMYIIELGSESIMKFQEDLNDKKLSDARKEALETLQFKINRVIENTRD